MARTPTEMARPTGEMTSQPQTGAALDRNGFYTPGSLPPRTPVRRPNPLRGLILPLVVAAVCGTGAFIVSNYYMTRWYTSMATVWFPAAGGQGESGILNTLIGTGGADATGSVSLLNGRYVSPELGAGPSTAMTALDSGRVRGAVMERLHLAQRWHLSPEAAGARFNKNVTYGVDKNGLLMLQANDTDPHLAQQIVNAYIQAMNDVTTELSTQRAHQNLVALRQRYATAEKVLAQDENELVALQQRMARTLPLGNSAATAYADLLSQQAAAQKDLDSTNGAIQAQLQTAKKTYGSGLELPTGVNFSNSTILELRKAQADFDRISAEYGPAYPGYREAQDHLNQAKQQAKTEIQRQYTATTKFISPEMSDLYVKRATSQATLDSLSRTLANRKAALLTLPDAQRRQADLNRLVTQQTGIDTMLAQAVAQAELAEKRDVPTYMIMDAAGVPDKPSLPRVGYTTALAAVAGFILTLAWLTARAMWGQATTQEQMRHWTDSYGLTESDAAPPSLGTEGRGPLAEHSAPQLPPAGSVPASQPEASNIQAAETSGTPHS